jgi:periplasmic divalent cation tolerance protein
MDSSPYIFVYVTVSETEIVKKIGLGILQQKLAACINVIPQMTSYYWWQNQIEESKESVLLIKTREELFEDLRSFIVNEHPYEVPCIVKIPIIGGHPDFLRWMDSQIGGSAPPSI